MYPWVRKPVEAKNWRSSYPLFTVHIVSAISVCVCACPHLDICHLVMRCELENIRIYYFFCLIDFERREVVEESKKANSRTCVWCSNKLKWTVFKFFWILAYFICWSSLPLQTRHPTRHFCVPHRHVAWYCSCNTIDWRKYKVSFTCMCVCVFVYSLCTLDWCVCVRALNVIIWLKHTAQTQQQKQ